MVMIEDLRGVFRKIRARLRPGERSALDAEVLARDALQRLDVYQGENVIGKAAAFLAPSKPDLSIKACRPQPTRSEKLTGPLQAANDRERLERLNACLARLDPKTRAIFLSYRMQGLSYQQIADQHGTSQDKVAQLVTMATLQLTSWMEDW